MVNYLFFKVLFQYFRQNQFNSHKNIKQSIINRKKYDPFYHNTVHTPYYDKKFYINIICYRQSGWIYINLQTNRLWFGFQQEYKNIVQQYLRENKLRYGYLLPFPHHIHIKCLQHRKVKQLQFFNHICIKLVN